MSAYSASNKPWLLPENTTCSHVGGRGLAWDTASDSLKLLQKKECFCSAVVTCILWHSNVWYWQDLCDSLGADLSWWDWLTSDRAARGQETWSQRSVGSGGQRWLRRARSGGAKPDEPPNCHLPSFLFLFLWFQLLAGRAHWFQRGWVLDNW